MSPPRPSGSVPPPGTRTAAGGFTAGGYEVIKTRLFVRLQERLEALKARRMPPSLFAEAARQQVEQMVEVEAARLPPDHRARLAREVAEEAFGFGPLEELFADPTVTQVTVLGLQAVLVVRKGQGWLPTNVRFRDEDQLAEVLVKVRGQGEAVAGELPASAFDVRLGNGFRAVAVVPPAASGAAPLAAFVRCDPAPAEAPPAAYPPGSAGGGTQPPRASGGGGTQADRAGGGPDATPRPTARLPGESVIDRHRQRITERFIAKLSALGVYDLSRIDSHELQKVIAAYVDEYCKAERIFLTDTDKGRVTLEILTGMGR